MNIQSDSDSFEFVSSVPSPVGQASFIVSKIDKTGVPHLYQILFDVKAHNILLRKSLLRRIGYRIPPTAWLEKFNIHFKGEFSKDEFIKDIERGTFLEATRWVTEKKQENWLSLQDAIIFDGATDPMYNLARGDMSSNIILGRRLFNSLLVLYNFTDVPESVNLYPWTPGRIFNKQLILPYSDAAEFSTPYEDARWITKRLLQLSRTDLLKSTYEAHYPQEVALLIVEKLISRRNQFRDFFNLDSDSEELPLNSNITLGDRLIDGKLQQIEWPGYASHFASTDPEDPLSGGEIWGLFRSKLISNLLTNLIAQFNDQYIPHTDIQFQVVDHAIDVAVKQFVDFILTGEAKRVPFGFWSTPTYSGHLIASREVIAGTYLGAENIVQLADTIGFSADLGLYIGADGLPSKISFASGLRASLVRTYTYLKPIHSIRSSLKEPFQNILVPWLKNRRVSPLEQLLDIEKNSKEVKNKSEYQKEISKYISEFKEKFGIGESIIVQNSIGPELNTSVGYAINPTVQLKASFFEKLTSLQRLNIVRKDENLIQIYKDPSYFENNGLSIGLQAKLQVLDLRWSWLQGVSKTEFYELNINDDIDENPELFDNIRALRQVLNVSRTSLAKKIQTPWKIAHDFKEKQFNFKIFWHRLLKQNSEDLVQVTHPDGVSKNFIRLTMGKRSGRNLESLSLEVLNGLIDEYVDPHGSTQLETQTSGNPGDTFKGRSVSRQVSLEAELQPMPNLDTMVVSVEHRWKGWDISSNSAQKILNEINYKYQQVVFPSLVLNQTKSIKFYNLQITLSLYREAIEHLISLSNSQIEELYKDFCILPQDKTDFIEAYERKFRTLISDISKSYSKGKPEDFSKKVTSLVSHVESTLNFQGFVQAIGGVDHLFLRGQISGFRVGDEGGEQDIYSHTIGEIGSEKPFGPLKAIQSQVGIMDGEMFIYWLLNRL